ncbi:unnamed protein product [Rhizophagus irregularis]|nr:unnamed protein product [Rhizophagus irregularis]
MRYRGKIFGISQNPYTNDYITILQNDYDGTCTKCGKYDVESECYWCKRCQKNYLKKIFINWTNGNEKIDNYIQKRRKTECVSSRIFEFIPYNQFDDIKEINKNNLYLAIWKNGPLSFYDKKWTRESNKKVYLRLHYLHYLQNTDKSLDKICKNDLTVYGISLNKNTKYCIIVSQYVNLHCERCGKELNYCERCIYCQVNDLKLNFANWTSGNENIDNLIQKMQLKVKSNSNMIFEWIPYDQFDNIKKINDENFAKIYSAIWKNDFYYYKYLYEKEIIRRIESKVNLKYSQNITYDSQNIATEFLDEIKKYSIKSCDEILTVYGISQDPDTKNYIMVFDYAKGNILSTSADLFISICISDMGLCGKADNIDKTNIYGVMPYVAPEVLRGNPYTQAADIYSFGMIMYFIATGRQPFSNHAHDEVLALDICNGIRPDINDQEAPKCYIDLMKWCWNSNPDNRPNVAEVHKLVDIFHLNTCGEQRDYDIQEQFKKANKYKKSNYFLEGRRKSAIHPQAVYTSQLLNSLQKVFLILNV